jgi:hypothetical protein
MAHHRYRGSYEDTTAAPTAADCLTAVGTHDAGRHRYRTAPGNGDLACDRHLGPWHDGALPADERLETIYTIQHQAHTLAPWTGLGVSAATPPPCSLDSSRSAAAPN